MNLDFSQLIIISDKMSGQHKRERITCERLSNMCMPFKEYFELVYEQLSDDDEKEKKEADRIIRSYVKIALINIENGKGTVIPQKYFDYVTGDLEKQLQEEYDFAMKCAKETRVVTSNGVGYALKK